MGEGLGGKTKSCGAARAVPLETSDSSSRTTSPPARALVAELSIVSRCDSGAAMRATTSP